MTKKVLIRNGKHQRPLLAIIERYGIGSVDTYNRGRWISVADLDNIKECMKKDNTRLAYRTSLCVMGTNMHNYVDFERFEELFADTSNT